MVSLPPFQSLLDAHAGDLHRFCVVRAGPDYGPDCFQETVISALRAYPSLRDGTNLRGWLFTIAHRKVIDHFRRSARAPRPTDALPEVVSPTVATPDGDLWSAVARLPDKQRGAIALRYIGDLPYADIAAVLGCSEAAARQNVRAGLAGLRTEVTP